jgi:hypothetical protein
MIRQQHGRPAGFGEGHVSIRRARVDQRQVGDVFGGSLGHQFAHRGRVAEQRAVGTDVQMGGSLQCIRTRGRIKPAQSFNQHSRRQHTTGQPVLRALEIGRQATTWYADCT